MVSKKMKILVVDDDVTTTELVKLYLERDGYWRQESGLC